ncbi:uncharacterized protein E0L32_004343 [Thyridium curvatum]|uniref:Uncharacterized protein n=1 Tax=Thyridium curvatum TaxID=1093900 RepID=A0A507AXY6_9PEZI|nr:uncharacterized protein E0L32_004343 [Thyridium curvatum]TPX15645.1 hypothetical protein E0L32_004343 [Thyridium curvatum]
MLPTPSTSHVPYARVYEPAEDSFLLLDTLSSPSEQAFLRSHFPASSSSSSSSPSPLLLEVGSGSGVVVAFLAANAAAIFGRADVLAAATDVNVHACRATAQTVAGAVAEAAASASSRDPESGLFLGGVQADLASPWRAGGVDVLVFNPPYVPTPDLPRWDDHHQGEGEGQGQAPGTTTTTTTFEGDSHLLSLSYAGGRDGMETTDRLIDSLPSALSARGCAYVLLCAQNRPEEVKKRIRGFDGDGGRRWRAETVGTSGKQAGWEKLQIVRIWRE